MLIVSSVKYSRGLYKSCNLVFYGFITEIHTVHFTGGDGVITGKFDIFSVDASPKFIEKYNFAVSLENGIKHKLMGCYLNSTAVKLYKNCFSLVPKNYYLEDFWYFGGNGWQAIMAYSVFSLFISGLVLMFFICEYKMRD